MDLLMLAPEIQEEILFGGIERPLRDVLSVSHQVLWVDQRRLLMPASKAA
jgi:hypothetical protein